MSFVAAAAAGAVVALQHSFEPDHVAAVSTLVDGERPAFVGASWGVGHSTVVLLAGLLFLIAGVRVPPTAAASFEVATGLLLVYLGYRALTDLVESSRSEYNHAHEGRKHAHPSFTRIGFGSGDTHLRNESALIGVVHGFAGSGVLVLLLAAGASSPLQAAVYLAVFSATTLVVMTALTHLWGKLLRTDLDRNVRGIAGTMSITLGALIVYEALGLVLL